MSDMIQHYKAYYRDEKNASFVRINIFVRDVVKRRLRTDRYLKRELHACIMQKKLI